MATRNIRLIVKGAQDGCDRWSAGKSAKEKAACHLGVDIVAAELEYSGLSGKKKRRR